MKRAVTYARFSTINQNDGSIDDQRLACADYAKANGLKIIRQYADPAISGAAFGNRPDAQKMLAAALAGDFAVILVADLTRLSRNGGELQRFLEQMRFRKVQVIGVLDHFDSDQRHSRMQAGLSGIMSDEYRVAVGERVHLAMRSLALQRKSTGAVLYGYDSKFAIRPEQAKVIREMFKRYAAGGLSTRELTLDLNKRGVPSPGRRADGRWGTPTVQEMLRNERYKGRFVWNKTRGVKDPESGIRKMRARPASEWISYDAPELAIVDAKTWDAVQMRLDHARKGTGPRGGAQRKFPLSGLLVCGVCGHTMHLVGSGGKRSAIRQLYTCGNARMAGPEACTNRLRVPLEVAEARLLEPAWAELLSDASVEKGAARIRAAMKIAAPKAAALTFKALDEKAEQVKKLVQSGALDADTAEGAFAKLETERAALKLAARPRGIKAVFGAEAEFRKQVKQLRADLRGEDAHAARAALATIYGPRIACKPTGGYLTAEYPLPVLGAVAMGAQVGRVQLQSANPLFACIPLIPLGVK